MGSIELSEYSTPESTAKLPNQQGLASLIFPDENAEETDGNEMVNESLLVSTVDRQVVVSSGTRTMDRGGDHAKFRVVT